MYSRENNTGCISAIVIAVIVLLAAVGGCFSFANKHLFGNKQWIDFKQTFNTAYIDKGNGKLEVIKIQSWKDYKNSDSIQIIDMNGKPYYTHLNRVILTNE